jgi:hypothetical protein
VRVRITHHVRVGCVYARTHVRVHVRTHVRVHAHVGMYYVCSSYRTLIVGCMVECTQLMSGK